MTSTWPSHHVLPRGSGGGGASGMDQIYPLSGYGLLAASGDPMMWQTSSGIGTGFVWLTRLWIPAGVAITNLWAAVAVAGTWDAVTTPNQLGLYTDAGAQVATTADDGTLWTATGWRGGALQGGPVAGQGTGRFVYVGLIVRGVTGMSLAFPGGSPADSRAPYASTGPAGGNRRAAYLSAQTALPASFTPTTVGTSTSFLALIGVT